MTTFPLIRPMGRARSHTHSRVRAIFAAPMVLLLLAASGCGDLIVSDRTLTIEGIGTVSGSVFLDADGNGAVDGEDPPFEGLGIQLVPAAGGSAVAATTTDTLGLFVMDSVPVGNFRLVIDPATLPDSIEVASEDPAPFAVEIAGSVERSFRLSFPTYTLQEVRELPEGQRVFTHGIVLNARDPFGDGAVHFQEDEVWLRATDVARATITRGDSVRVLGRTATEAGRPILTDARTFMLVQQAMLTVPVGVTTADARTADAERLDAALARVQSADVVDTVSVGQDLVVTVNDGSGPLEVVLRGFIEFDRTAMVPGGARFSRADGLLVAIRNEQGYVRWRLTPRGTGDVVVVQQQE
jgi:hypothetical protein